MGFIDLLVPQGDKVILSELTKLQGMLPARVTAPIPACMYRNINTGRDDMPPELDFEVFTMLVWVIANREPGDMTLEEVGDRMGMGNVDNLRKIVQEVWYFYTAKTRDDVEAVIGGGEAEEDAGAKEPVNPPKSSPSETK